MPYPVVLPDHTAIRPKTGSTLDGWSLIALWPLVAVAVILGLILGAAGHPWWFLLLLALILLVV